MPTIAQINAAFDMRVKKGLQKSLHAAVLAQKNCASTMMKAWLDSTGVDHPKLDEQIKKVYQDYCVELDKRLSEFCLDPAELRRCADFEKEMSDKMSSIVACSDIDPRIRQLFEGAKVSAEARYRRGVDALEKMLAKLEDLREKALSHASDAPK